MSWLARAVLFASSYAPLLILFAILESFGTGWPSWACGILGVASIIALSFVWWALRRQLAVDQARFEGARNRDADVMAYVVTYIVPFAAATDANQGTRIALVVFATMIAVLYVRSAVFYVHPLLLFVGLHVYEATRNGVPVVVLTRQRHLRQSCNLRVVSIGHNVYLERLA